MARQCMVTGKKAMSGNYVSHSNNKTKRRHGINLLEKKIWIPEQKKWVRVKISAKALKTIHKNGAASVLSKAGVI
ncbi:MAG: 50S ribosomal protein L28 [Fibrobacteres bacterium]|nr:50S ribosomal protein L28 [Fibrobacterota bacterium]